jgi:hypothetical protein
VHSAQDTTVDTSHTLVTPRTSQSALYVGMSRGRDVNTAHITTRTAPEDLADGTDAHEVRRDPVAALAAVLNDTDETTRSALTTATESGEEALSARTPAELLADAANLAATQRTATWLDQLTADGALTIRDRSRVAAEDGAASLTRVLRSAEIAGHDARQVLHDAIADRPLDGVRNATNVIYHRITEAHRFDPAGETWAGWTPKIDDPDWQHYLDQLATAADRRAAQLGAEAAADAPAWAVAAFGEAPNDPTARDLWIDDVGRVAAYREIRGHDNDDDALGPAQARPGRAIRRIPRCMAGPWAAPRSTVRSWSSPTASSASASAPQSEKPPGPRATSATSSPAPARPQPPTARPPPSEQLAESTPEESQADLRRQATEAAALAEVLDERAQQLTQLDDARSRWLAHTAATRAAGDRAQAEFALRRAGAEPEQQVTAEEWLVAHREDQLVEDQQREITAEYELDERAAEAAGVRTQEDLRDQAASEPRQLDEDAVRVPSADEVTTALDRAHRALVEINAREAYESGDEAEERAADLNRWSADDRAAEEDLVAADEE